MLPYSHDLLIRVALYTFFATATFIAVYGTHDKDFSVSVNVIGSLLIASVWPLFLTAKFIQKLL